MLKKQPKTPLKRVSRNSLRSQTLLSSSARRSEQDQDENPTHESSSPSSPSSSASSATTRNHPFSHHLNQLAPLFTDLSDAITDLHINLSNLDLVCQDLDQFNESFSALIYGLRMNAYITDFDQAPKLNSFLDFQAHQQQQQEQERQRQQAELEKAQQAELDRKQANNDQADQESFMTTDQSTNQVSTSRDPSNMHQGRQTKAKPTNATKIGNSKSKSFTQATKVVQKQLIKFSQDVIGNLPLKFREQQPHRQEMELVICVLKLNPQGLLIKDIVKLEPSLAMHRVRECVTALTVAKKAVKLNKDGVVYKLIVN